MSILYEDQYIVCDEQALVIKNYYFPMGSKRILYESIRQIDKEPVSLIDGKLRLWGMGLNPKWYHLDPQRIMKDTALVLDINALIKPTLTPDNLEQVYEVLMSKVSLH